MGGSGETASNSKPKAGLSPQYYRIPAHLYQEGEIIDKDLYLHYQGQYILYRPKNLTWKAADRERLIEFSIDHLYIQCDTISAHHSFLESNLSRILDQPKIDRNQKTLVLYETSQAIISDIFEKPSSPDTVRRSVGFVKNSVDFLKDQENFHQFMRLATSNFSEYTHAIQVSAYAIALAREVGMKSFNELSAIGVGSILHDLGKVKIDKRILDKPSALDNDERREMEKHPQYGFEILQKQRTIPETAEQIVLQHHERPTGNGYPYHLGSDMICSAKIVSIADCFDSLTSDRPWEKKRTALEALELMRKDYVEEYEANLLVAFIRVIGIKG